MIKTKSFPSIHKFSAFITANRLTVCPVLREEIWSPDRGDSDLDEEKHFVFLSFSDRSEIRNPYYIAPIMGEIVLPYDSVIFVEDVVKKSPSRDEEPG